MHEPLVNFSTKHATEKAATDISTSYYLKTP